MKFTAKAKARRKAEAEAAAQAEASQPKKTVEMTAVGPALPENETAQDEAARATRAPGRSVDSRYLNGEQRVERQWDDYETEYDGDEDQIIAARDRNTRLINMAIKNQKANAAETQRSCENEGAEVTSKQDALAAAEHKVAEETDLVSRPVVAVPRAIPWHQQRAIAATAPVSQVTGAVESAEAPQNRHKKDKTRARKRHVPASATAAAATGEMVVVEISDSGSSGAGPPPAVDSGSSPDAEEEEKCAARAQEPEAAAAEAGVAEAAAEGTAGPPKEGAPEEAAAEEPKPKKKKKKKKHKKTAKP